MITVYGLSYRVPEFTIKAIDSIVAAAKCPCKGTGKWEMSCTLCGDSTYDHYCNDKLVDCDKHKVSIRP